MPRPHPTPRSTLEPPARRIADALRTKSWRDVHVVSEHAPHLSLHFEVTPAFIRATARPDGADIPALEALGWRWFADEGVWKQYFYPQRGADRRRIGRWAMQTLVDAYGSDPTIFILRGESTFRPVFECASDGAAPLDCEFADVASGVLADTDFEVSRAGTHFGLICRRKHHVVQLAIQFSQSTFCTRALHLVEPDPGDALSYLAVNPSLGHCPYVYAMGRLSDGRGILVLESKTAVPPYATLRQVMGGLMAGTIEPLIAAHRHLHCRPS